MGGVFPIYEKPSVAFVLHLPISQNVVSPYFLINTGLEHFDPLELIKYNA